MSKEMITLVFGVVSNLPILVGLLQIPKEMLNSLSERLKRIVTMLIILGIVAGCATQAIQYKQAINSDNEKREAERKFARLLFLFNTKEHDLSTEYLREDPYVAGYQAFHQAFNNNTEFTAAEALFKEAINHKKFEPESHYLLAYISLVNYERSQDAKYLGNAMVEAVKATADSEYMAPLYLLAIAEVNSGMEEDKWMKNLETAARGDGIQCANLQRPDELKRWWKKFAQDPKFKRIQAECGAHWHLLPLP